MRTYYLFRIKNEFYDIYLKNPYSLYKTLENLYAYKNRDLNLGISLFTQLCEFHNVDLLDFYFSSKKYPKKNKTYILKSKKTNEITLLTINPSVIEIKTNINIPKILKILNYYSIYIFACDFKNKDYFWINKTYQNK